MDELAIENAELRVVVQPDFGARVVSLIDRRSGRDWMAKGEVSANTGEDARYGVGEAVGWDECFPTVGACDASGTAWGRPLRDHGDLWGRPWRVDGHSRGALTTTFTGDEFRFCRRLELNGARLTADYQVENLDGEEPLPFMWALHALLVTEAGESIDFPGIDRIRAGGMRLAGVAVPGGDLPWPGPVAGLPFPLDRIQPGSADFMGKFYLAGVPALEPEVGGSGRRLHFAWSGLDHLGIWLTYGGWPEKGGAHHVALEPTTAPADDLMQALHEGTMVTIEPGGTAEWRVEIMLVG
jgi:galactose mutarotase-like enzyme